MAFRAFAPLLLSWAAASAQAAEIGLWPEGVPEPRVPGGGFGMRPRDNAPGTSDWPNRALDWLRTRWAPLTNSATAP